MHLPRTARSRQLGLRLKQFRLTAGLTVAEVTRRTGTAKSSMHRIEGGQVISHPRTLRDLLDLYGVSEQLRADVLALANSAQSDGGWLHAYTGLLPDEYLDYVAFESDAVEIDTYECLLIPGLLQTEDYTRAMVAGILDDPTSEDVERRVEVRRQRRAALERGEPVGLRAVVDEAALWRVVGSPAIMATQLRALLKPPANVRLQVIPYANGAHAGMIGSFVYMRFADAGAADLVYCETPAGELFREAEAELGRFQTLFARLQAAALSEGDSAALIESVARKLKRGG
jgi:transcriptional regulator with XRE-family HTH domain